MANKKQTETKNEVVESKKSASKPKTTTKTVSKSTTKTSTKPTTKSITKSNATKKNTTTNKTTATKSTSNKKNSVKQTVNNVNTKQKNDDNKAVKKTATKKTTASKKSDNKKTVSKSTTKKTQINVVKEKEDIKVNSVELANVLEEKSGEINNIDKNVNNTNDIIEQKKEETSIKLEEAKFSKRKNNKLLLVGVFIVTLGIIALILSLIANRIVDREFLSDNSITLMMIASIIIEGFGAFIIINESN